MIRAALILKDSYDPFAIVPDKTQNTDIDKVKIKNIAQVMRKENILTSIIMPVYNAERFLALTLDSVLAQTYKDFELIIIDDGSTDKSREIIGQYAEKDNRIKAFFVGHEGAGNARNVGIDHAVGEYMLPFDADDIMASDCLETLLCAAAFSGQDLIAAGRVPKSVINESGKEFFKTENSDRTEIIRLDDETSLEALAEIAPGGDNKLFKMSIIKEHGIRWRNGNIGQDVNFFYKYLSVIDSYSIIDKSVYSYRVILGSLSHKASLHIIEIVDQMKDVETFAAECGKHSEFSNAIGNLAIHHYYAQCRKYVYFSKKDRKKVFFSMYNAMMGIEKEYADHLNKRSKSYLQIVKKKHRYHIVYLSDLYCRYVRYKEKGRIGGI